jgi:hypothetical protein
MKRLVAFALLFIIAFVGGVAIETVLAKPWPPYTVLPCDIQDIYCNGSICRCELYPEPYGWGSTFVCAPDWDTEYCATCWLAVPCIAVEE